VYGFNKNHSEIVYCMRYTLYWFNMHFHIITLLPRAIEEYTHASILGRAQKNKKISIRTYDLRKWGVGKHKKVDDRPFGGGPGMVMTIKPIAEAVKSIQKSIEVKGDPSSRKATKGKKVRVILFSTRGKLFTEKEAKRLAKYSDLSLIWGRYEGVDERVAQHVADEEISFGGFVLTGGEIPAMAVIDAVSRFIPGVLGKQESREDVKGSYPVYTRPEKFGAWKVPKALISGDHKKIQNWRES